MGKLGKELQSIDLDPYIQVEHRSWEEAESFHFTWYEEGLNKGVTLLVTNKGLAFVGGDIWRDNGGVRTWYYNFLGEVETSDVKRVVELVEQAISQVQAWGEDKLREGEDWRLK